MVGTDCFTAGRSQVTDKQVPLSSARGFDPITLKVLLKVGPANTGEFYRTPDLVLPEAAVAPEAGRRQRYQRGSLLQPAGCDIAVINCRQSASPRHRQA